MEPPELGEDLRGGLEGFGETLPPLELGRAVRSALGLELEEVSPESEEREAEEDSGPVLQVFARLLRREEAPLAFAGFVVLGSEATASVEVLGELGFWRVEAGGLFLAGRESRFAWMVGVR